jgi:hypothetical protein
MGPGDLRPEVVAFMRWRPELLHRFEPAEKAFPSPRAWVLSEFVPNYSKRTIIRGLRRQYGHNLTS